MFWPGLAARRRPTLPQLGLQYHGRWGVSRPSSGWDRVWQPRRSHRATGPGQNAPEEGNGWFGVGGDGGPGAAARRAVVATPSVPVRGGDGAGRGALAAAGVDVPRDGGARGWCARVCAVVGVLVAMIVPGGGGVGCGGVGERVCLELYRAIRTARLHALLRFHLRPIDVVVYHGPRGGPVLRGVSRLDAFSGYPVRTWLPGCAAGATTGAPEVRPSRSSRTRDGSSQASYTHGR